MSLMSQVLLQLKSFKLKIDEDPKGVASAISNMVELGEGEMKDTLAQA